MHDFSLLSNEVKRKGKDQAAEDNLVILRLYFFSIGLGLQHG